MIPQLNEIRQSPPPALRSARLLTREILGDVLPADYIARQAARQAAQTRARLLERRVAAIFSEAHR